MKKFISIFAALLLVASMTVIFAACGEKKEETPATDTTTQTTDTAATDTSKTNEIKEEPKAEEKTEDKAQEHTKTEEKTEQPATGDFLATIVFETSKGTFSIGLFKDTPIASNNMIEKVKAGAYNGLTFHRIMKEFMIQGGDPSGDGTGGGNMEMDPMPNGNMNKKGTIVMASSSPDKPIKFQSDMQFFINTVDNEYLTSKYGFVAFGEVTSGWETIENIASTPVGSDVRGEMSMPQENVTIKKAFVK